MKENVEGFLYPVIDASRCVDCGLCAKTCMAKKQADNTYEKSAYAMSSKDDAIRRESSSGGVFTLIAEYVISNGGVVYGAAFDEEYNVCHIRISNRSEIAKLRTSKYVQSRIGDCYKSAKQDLDNGVKVLFTGTPCQLAGLRGYLKRDYDGLFCQDVMCHGAPSPKLWRKYLDELNIGKIERISFRDKTVGWSLFSMKIEGEKGTVCEKFFDNTYMKAFLADIALRQSCYNCNCNGLNYFSDITLADFWGLDKAYPELDDNRGVSLVLVNSDKGKRLIDAVSEGLNISEVDITKSLKGNKAAITDTPCHKNREKFMADIDTQTVDWLVKKYVVGNIFERIIRKIKRHR
jgi:coenzyme F420-reducing hydrogenase beta subunit